VNWTANNLGKSVKWTANNLGQSVKWTANHRTTTTTTTAAAAATTTTTATATTATTNWFNLAKFCVNILIKLAVANRVGYETCRRTNTPFYHALYVNNSDTWLLPSAE
jgi:hypothetical protein